MCSYTPVRNWEINGRTYVMKYLPSFMQKLLSIVLTLPVVGCPLFSTVPDVLVVAMTWPNTVRYAILDV